MSIASASRSALGKRPGKQNRSHFGVRGSTAEPKANLLGGARRLSLRLVVQEENSGLVTPLMPKATESPQGTFERLPMSLSAQRV